MFIPTLVLLLALSLHVCCPAAAQQLAENLTITSVQGSESSGCVNTGLVALNCSRSFTLRLTVVRIVELPLPAYSFVLEVDNYTQAFYYNAFAAAATATSIAFPVSEPVSRLLSGALLSVSLQDLRNRSAVVSSPVTGGFSFAAAQVPEVTGVSGCQPTDDPLLTRRCLPEVDVLTLRGAGFTQLPVRVPCLLTRPGQGGFSFSMSLQYGPLLLLNDSTLLLPVSEVRHLTSLHYDGGLVTLFFVVSGYKTGWSWTMAHLPVPVIDSYTVLGFQPVLVNNVSTFPHCLPGVSLISLYGQWLYWTSITVGGALCDNSKGPNGHYNSEPDQVVCRLPNFASSLTGGLYDVVFNSTQGAVLTLPGIVGFTSQPSIVSVSACWSDGTYITDSPPLRCLAGETVTVYGRRFLSAGLTLTNVTLLLRSAAPVLLLCLNLTVVSDSALSCVLPPTSAAGMSAWDLHTVWGGNYTSNRLAPTIYDYAYAPRILSVSGCGQSSSLSTGLALTGCQQGDVITVSGINLAAVAVNIRSTASASTGYSSFYCAPLTVLSNETATCQLPTAPEFPSLLWSAQYNLSMLQPGHATWPPVASNYFIVSFAPPCSPYCSSSASPSSVSLFSSSSSFSTGGGGGGASSTSSSGSTVAVVASVLSVLALLGLVAAGWWLWRQRVRRGDGKEADASWSSGDSADETTTSAAWQNFNPAANSTADIELTDG